MVSFCFRVVFFMVLVWYSYGCRMVFYGFVMVFNIVFVWCSYSFRMVFFIVLWFSCGFLYCFIKFSYSFLIVCLLFFIRCSYSFLMVFILFSCGFLCGVPIAFLFVFFEWFLFGFRLVFLWF